MVSDCGTGRRHRSGAGAAAGSVRASLLFWGFWSLQAALALGQQLSKTGSVLHRGSRGGGAAGTGTKGLLFPGSAGRAGGGSCPPGSAAQGTGSLKWLFQGKADCFSTWSRNQVRGAWCALVSRSRGICQMRPRGVEASSTHKAGGGMWQSQALARCSGHTPSQRLLPRSAEPRTSIACGGASQPADNRLFWKTLGKGTPTRF